MNAFSAGKLQVYDAVNVIYDVITTANPLPDTAKFIYIVLEIIKLNKSDIGR